jgi:hypothetical protein
MGFPELDYSNTVGFCNASRLGTPIRDSTRLASATAASNCWRHEASAAA